MIRVPDLLKRGGQVLGNMVPGQQPLNVCKTKKMIVDFRKRQGDVMLPMLPFTLKELKLRMSPASSSSVCSSKTSPGPGKLTLFWRLKKLACLQKPSLHFTGAPSRASHYCLVRQLLMLITRPSRGW